MSTFFLTIIQTIVVLGAAPFAFGLVRTIKARLQGRRGPSPFLPYISLATLFRKEMVVASHVSFVFRFVPYAVLASAVFLVVVLPLVSVGGAFASFSNMFVVSGALALGAVFLVFGGLESSSAFGGMGASREMTITALLEPVIIVTLTTLTVVTGVGTIDGALAMQVSLAQAPYLALTVAALLFIALAENARYPVDNPATHLELTMIHEATVIEYSGPYLAMLEYASMVKLTVFALLVTNILIPFGMLTSAGGFVETAIAVAAAALKLVTVMAALAILESSIAKMRFYRMQEFTTGALFIGLGALVLALMRHAL